MTERRYSVAVDFDGVLHSYTSPWVAEDVIPDPPVEGAIEWLNEMLRDFIVVIHTTRGRSDAGRVAVVNWLAENGLAFPEDRGTGIRVTDVKLPALVYLDDRAIRFEGPGTFPTREQIHRALPWNKAVTARDDVDRLDAELRTLGRLIADALGLPRFAAWLARRLP